MTTGSSLRTLTWILCPPLFQWCLSRLKKSTMAWNWYLTGRYSIICPVSWSDQSKSWEEDSASTNWSLSKPKSWFWSDNALSSLLTKSWWTSVAKKATESNWEWSLTTLTKTWTKNSEENWDKWRTTSRSRDTLSSWEFMAKTSWTRPKTSSGTSSRTWWPRLGCMKKLREGPLRARKSSRRRQSSTSTCTTSEKRSRLEKSSLWSTEPTFWVFLSFTNEENPLAQVNKPA